MAAPEPALTEAAPLALRKADATPGNDRVLTVLLVLGLAIGGGALVAMRSGSLRLLPGRRADARRSGIERLSTQMLARGSALHAVRWHDEELLIGCTERQFTLLARRSAAPASGEGA